MNYLLLAAAALQAFNLNCTGKSYGNGVGSFAYTYRVDLSKKRWCEGECLRTFDFAEISPSRLTLARERKYTLGGPVSTTTFIDRVTGEYSSVYRKRDRWSGEIVVEWMGECERAPFTGLPPVVPKF